MNKKNFRRKKTEKISLSEGDEEVLSDSLYEVGDLVKIKIHDWDATPHVYTGIVLARGCEWREKQLDMFPTFTVWNINTQQRAKLYSYNLEILSSCK